MLICFASTTQAQVKVKPAKQQFTKMGCATIEPFQQVFAFDTVNTRSILIIITYGTMAKC
jgi:hypothetical protein